MNQPLDKLSFVMLPLTITLVSQMANSQTHALNSPLPFQELISESLNCLTMSSAYMNSLSTPFVISINIRKCGEKPNLRSPTHV